MTKELPSTKPSGHLVSNIVTIFMSFWPVHNGHRLISCSLDWGTATSYGILIRIAFSFFWWFSTPYMFIQRRVEMSKDLDFIVSNNHQLFQLVNDRMDSTDQPIYISNSFPFCFAHGTKIDASLRNWFGPRVVLHQ